MGTHLNRKQLNLSLKGRLKVILLKQAKDRPISVSSSLLLLGSDIRLREHETDVADLRSRDKQLFNKIWCKNCLYKWHQRTSRSKSSATELNTPRKGNSQVKLPREVKTQQVIRHAWHLLENRKKHIFLFNVWFTSAMCHYDRNVSVCFPIVLAAGHHMHVEQNTEHSVCLPGKINKSHSLSLSLSISLSLSGWMGNIRRFQQRGQRSPCHSLLEQDQMPVGWRGLEEENDGKMKNKGTSCVQQSTKISTFLIESRFLLDKKFTRDKNLVWKDYTIHTTMAWDKTNRPGPWQKCGIKTQARITKYGHFWPHYLPPSPCLLLSFSLWPSLSLFFFPSAGRKGVSVIQGVWGHYIIQPERKGPIQWQHVKRVACLTHRPLLLCNYLCEFMCAPPRLRALMRERYIRVCLQQLRSVSIITVKRLLNTPIRPRLFYLAYASSVSPA